MAVAGRMKVIVNTFGGRLGGQARLRLVEQAMQSAGLDFELAPTNSPEQGMELARQAAFDGWPVVVAAGGDGTINQVVNGLVQAAGNAEAGVLGILPLGTANDLADGLALPRDLAQACLRLAAGNTRLIDVGQVNNHYFANNSAVGLEAVVTVTHDKMRWLQGNARYIVAALKTILKARPWQMCISWPGGQFDGPVNLVSVGNNCRTGGSFYMTPQAKLDDGLLDFVYAMGLGRWQMLRLLPKTFTGNHIHHPAINYRQTTTLSIEVDPPTPIQADGEIIDAQATTIRYRLIPQKLRVIV